MNCSVKIRGHLFFSLLSAVILVGCDGFFTSEEQEQEVKTEQEQKAEQARQRRVATAVKVCTDDYSACGLNCFNKKESFEMISCSQQCQSIYGPCLRRARSIP